MAKGKKNENEIRRTKEEGRIILLEIMFTFFLPIKRLPWQLLLTTLSPWLQYIQRSNRATPLHSTGLQACPRGTHTSTTKLRSLVGFSKTKKQPLCDKISQSSFFFKFLSSMAFSGDVFKTSVSLCWISAIDPCLSPSHPISFQGRKYKVTERGRGGGVDSAQLA